jgi:hypothetical protein
MLLRIYSVYTPYLLRIKTYAEAVEFEGKKGIHIKGRVLRSVAEFVWRGRRDAEGPLVRNFT